jgi:hypothetical protein
MKERNIIDAFNKSKEIDRSRPDLYIIDPKLKKWVLKSHVDMMDSILDEVSRLYDCSFEDKTDLEWWGEEEVKTWSSPNYGTRYQELPEELMKEALETVFKKRVIVTKLSNIQLSCLERACVKTHRFDLWNRCTNEMLKRPDFVPERGTYEEQDLIKLLPNSGSKGEWEHVGERPFDSMKPYKSSYSAYKSGTNPESVKYKLRQGKMDLTLDLLYKKVGVADEYEYIVAYGSRPFDVYYHNALLKEGEAYQGSVTRTI